MSAMTGAEHIAAAQKFCEQAGLWSLGPAAAASASLAQAHATVALVLALTEALSATSPAAVSSSPSALSRVWARLRAVVRWSW